MNQDENPTSERRAGPRVALDAAAIIRIGSLDGPVPSRILNASINGLLLVMPEPRAVGTRMHITIQIGDPVYEIQVSGIIVHAAEDKTAAPGFSARVGIFLTQTNPDWIALCKRLTRDLQAAL